MKKTELSEARLAAYRARAGMKRLMSTHKDVKVPRVDVVAEVRDSDAEVRAAEVVSELVNVQIDCVCLLHEIGKRDFATIDRLFGMKAGSSEKLKKEYPSQWHDHTLRHCDTVIETFYRSKVSILEHLMVAAPATIEFLKKMQAGDYGTGIELRMQAGKEIREWTQMYFKTRQSKTGRELVDPKMQAVADEGETLETLLDTMLSGALEDGKEN